MKVLVFGATGTQGGATTRQLLARGVKVRAVTRKPNGANAQALVAAGAEVVQANMKDRASVDRVMAGVDGVFSVQNGWEPGNDEVVQGKHVADAALAAGVKHLVYTSVARADDHPGLRHFAVKWEIERYLKTTPLVTTVLRPVYFMDNLWGKMSGMSWSALRDVVGRDTKLQMIAGEDIGRFAALAFVDRDRWAHRTVEIAGDDVTWAEAREAHVRALGREPTHAPVLRVVLMGLMGEARRMFQWYREPRFGVDIAALEREVPDLVRIDAFFRKKS